MHAQLDTGGYSSVDLHSCNWIVAITGCMYNCLSSCTLMKQNKRLSCTKEKNKRSIWLFHASSTWLEGCSSVELRSCKWVIAITGLMSNFPWSCTLIKQVLQLGRCNRMDVQLALDLCLVFWTRFPSSQFSFWEFLYIMVFY